MAAKFDHSEMMSVLSFGVELRFKDKSWIMRLLSKITLWDPAFMRRTMTVGTKVYFPSQQWVDEDPEHAWMVLAHEMVHIRDYKKLGKFAWLFYVAYAMPQGLALLSLLGLVFHSWWPLLFLLFLAPLPAPWRTEYEMRAFAMTMATRFWVYGGGIPQDLKEHVATCFTGPKYYWMYPFKTLTKKRVGRWTKSILCGEILGEGFKDYPYVEVHDLVKARLQPRRS